MVLNFHVNQAMYLALAREEAAPLREALAALPEIPPDCQWANFVRNHDELTLDKLSEDERAEVFAAFGPEPDAPALRPRAAPAAADDARRRPAPDADGLLPRLLPARHAGAVLRRGDRDGARTSTSRAATACARRCSGPTNRTAGSPRSTRGRAVPAGGRRRAAGRPSRQRRRASGATRLAAELDRAADPPPARVPRARLGPLHAARRRRPRRARAPRRLGRTARSSRCTPSPAAGEARVELERGDGRGWSTCSATSDVGPGTAR